MRTYLVAALALVLAACGSSKLRDVPGAPVVPVCGDGKVDEGEVCDGELLGGATCVGEGFDGGTLRCSSTCALDTRRCTRVEICDNGVDDDGDGDIDCQDAECYRQAPCPRCGDGIVNLADACDGGDLGGQSCESLGFDEGTLLCSDACAFDTSGCVRFERCDNGKDDDGDGKVDCEDEHCVGRAPCPHCGDGAVNFESEACDGADIPATCADFGFSLGEPRCTETCTLDLDHCGDPEDCSGGGDEDRDGLADCADPDCLGAFDCPVCGDGIVQRGEACDGSIDSTCVDHGFDAGTPACTACEIDLSDCHAIVCGDGQVEGAERCDDGNTSAADGCSPGCQIEGDVCEAPFPLAWNVARDAWSWAGDTAVLYSDYAGSCADTSARPDAVASFTAPATGRYYATVTAGYDAVLWAWRGTCGSAAPQAGCIDDSRANEETLEFALDAGETVYLVVAASATASANSGPFVLDVGEVICGDGVLQGWEQCEDGNTADGDGCNSLCRFEGDNCTDTLGAGAWDINALGSSPADTPEFLAEQLFASWDGAWLWRGSTVRATDDLHGAGACSGANGRDVVAKFRAPAAGTYVIWSFASFLTELYVLDGACSASAPQLACSTPSVPPPPGYVTPPEFAQSQLQLAAGQTIFIVVDGTSGNFGDFWLAIWRAESQTCGNGVLEGPERCDDGNNLAGDGCGPTCAMEERWIWGSSNYSFASAMPIAPGEILYGGGVHGPEFFRVEANAGTTFRAHTTGWNASCPATLMDSYLIVYDAAGDLIGSNDDYGGTKCSEVIWTAAATGTYYLELGLSSPSVPMFGPYVLWRGGDDFHLFLEQL